MEAQDSTSPAKKASANVNEHNGAASQGDGATATTKDPDAQVGKLAFQGLSFNLKRQAQETSIPDQIWKRYGFLLLWTAVGLDIIISMLGWPICGQTVSAVLVSLYLVDNVSFRRAVCSFWFAVIDIFFREISIGGDTKLAPLKLSPSLACCGARKVGTWC